MGLLGKKTFRVYPSPTFAFQSANGTIYYPHSQDMWNDKIDWEEVKRHAGNGTTQGAAIIEKGLRYLNQYQPGEKHNLTQDEVELVKYVIGKSKMSMLDFSKSLSSAKRGLQFEQRFTRLLEKLTIGEGQIGLGSKMVSSPLEIKLSVDLTGTGIQGKKGHVDDLWKLVEKELGTDYKELIGKAYLDLQIDNNESNNSTVGTIIIRQANAPGKVDSSALNRTAVTFEQTSTISEDIQNLANELAGHTFSIKNYSSSRMEEWKGVSLGYANDFRFASSFLYGSTGGASNFQDLCTFIFASSNSPDPTVHKYTSWARYIYELTGIGQSNGVVADYLIINTSDKGIEDIKVYAIRDLIDNAPNGEPKASLKTVQFKNWKGEVQSKEKFIFDTSN